MFCVCVIIVLILVSFVLCCAPLRAFIFCFAFTYFVTCICVHYLRVGSLPAFEHLSTHLLQVNASSSLGLSFFDDVCAALVWAFASHLRTRYSINGCAPDYVCVHWSYLLWDSALVLLTLFAYRIARTLQETLVLFTRSCLSP
jgi:hypothetical protein